MLYGDYVSFTKLTHVCTTCQQLYMHTVIIPLFARFHSSRISLCMTYVLVYNIFDIEYKNTRHIMLQGVFGSYSCFVDH